MDDNYALLRKELTADAISLFQKIIYDHFKKNARSFPWRNTADPYHILLSEIMLQQTPVERVIPKYNQFIKVFPDFSSLAKEPLKKILKFWQGLGYNRRAIALKNIAQIVVSKFGGKLPCKLEDLTALPGIGRATAAAIITFAFNQTTIFIETNIRTVFIHFFFPDSNNIKDKNILLLIEKTLDTSDPREWYYALMDYGAMLKKCYKNINKKSAHYQKQTAFKGSNRQIRGMILRVLITGEVMTKEELVQRLELNVDKVKKNLIQLQKEGFINEKEKRFSIA